MRNATTPETTAPAQTGRLTASKNSVAIVLVTPTLFLANLIGRFPGVTNLDANEQYAQAISHQFYDWHPPVMAWLWSGLRLIADGTGPLFTLHVFCYWLGFGLIATALSRVGRNIAAWAVITVGLLPPFFTMNGNIFTDVGLAVAFLSAYAIVFWYRSQDRNVAPVATIIAMILLLYGILVRANGVFGAAPLVVYLLYPKTLARPLHLFATKFINYPHCGSGFRCGQPPIT
jgi:hypothetical protein